jgi:hypothetical protein
MFCCHADYFNKMYVNEINFNCDQWKPLNLMWNHESIFDNKQHQNQ